MSDLIPEKRRDKNGRLVTRHVRPAAATKRDTALPVPTASPESFRGLTAAPVKTQFRTHFRFFPAPDKITGYKDLWVKLGITSRLDIGGFHASDYEMYDVLSVTDSGTALALLEYGIRSSKDAVRKLRAMGLEDLLEDNSGIASEALSRRIMPETYIRRSTPGTTSSEHFLDYLEVADINMLDSYQSLHAAVLVGTIRTADVKALGPQRIRMADDWPAVKKMLSDLADESVSYTAEEAGRIIEQNAAVSRHNRLSDSLLLADRYGAEFAIEVPATVEVLGLSEHLRSQGIDAEKSRSVLRYYREVESRLPLIAGARLIPGFSDIIRFHDAGADPEQVAKGRITVNQIEAINTHGIAPSVAGGWL